MMNPNLDLNIASFLTNLKRLHGCVSTIVVPHAGQPFNDRTPISLKVRHCFQNVDLHACARWFGRFSNELVKIKGGDALARNPSLKVGMPSNVDSLDRLYVELLTASWLCLYFLGVPSGSPWGFVKTWAETRGGGLPNGVCVAKAIGDIVRASRRANHNYRLFPTTTSQHDLTLYMHSYLPVLLFPELLDTGSEIMYQDVYGRPKPIQNENGVTHQSDGVPSDLHSRLPEYVHGLGRCYEFLQIALYVRDGYPILYSIPEQLVVTLHAHFSKDEEDKRAAWLKRCNVLQQNVFALTDDTDACAKSQRMALLTQGRPPACFLNHESGLFTFEGLDAHERREDLPLPASYMHETRRTLYRARLLAAEPDFSPGSEERFRNILYRQHNVELYDRLIAT
ncbi:hypothetical protein P3T18_002988 [Paraburkholderia sp. GAS199]|uniref:hypothetical protein n=1 Tax=Paraburkholderia sp. GAS199 TaxID=3035126 RepID=UPI003D25665C